MEDENLGKKIDRNINRASEGLSALVLSVENADSPTQAEKRISRLMDYVGDHFHELGGFIMSHDADNSELLNRTASMLEGAWEKANLTNQRKLEVIGFVVDQSADPEIREHLKSKITKFVHGMSDPNDRIEAAKRLTFMAPDDSLTRHLVATFSDSVDDIDAKARKELLLEVMEDRDFTGLHEEAARIYAQNPFPKNG